MAGKFRRLGTMVGAVAAAAIVLTATSFSTSAAESCTQQNANDVSVTDAQSPLEGLRRDCPLLGKIVEEFALRDLGEAESKGGFDAHTRAIALAVTSAAVGDMSSIERHARNALDAGATRSELEELLYLTALYAGVPKAVEATRALSDLIAEREGW
jgi:4-carboxymuconolactone decarboxylase